MTPRAVAFQQRLWLQKLERLQPGSRTILAQTHKECAWTPWRELDPTAVFWTRGILVNEVVFDADAPDKTANEDAAAAIADIVPVDWLCADTGGRGWHVHAFIDPATVRIFPELRDEAKALDVDMWKAVREVVFNAIVKESGVTTKLDKSKVSWDAKKKGSMIRDFGSVGSLGYAKTLTPPTLTFPKEPPAPWDVGAFGDAIERAIRRRVEAARKAKDAPAPSAPTPGVEACSCIAKASSEGAPQGERKRTLLHILNVARSSGASMDEAMATARPFFERSGLAQEDSLQRFGEYVYARDARTPMCQRGRLACCEGENACPLGPLRLSV